MKDLLPLLEQVAKLGQPLAVICEIPTETSDGRRPGGMSPEGGMY